MELTKQSATARTARRLVHCSDIHLDDSHAGGLQLRARFELTLTSAAGYAPDVLIIAGDLFDTNRVPDLTVEWAMQTLAEQPYPVVMIPGNHDCMQPQGIFSRFDFDQISNIAMLSAADGELRVLADLQLAFWGRGMVDHCPEYKPLDGAPVRPTDSDWYIGVGHGIYVPTGAETHRSSPVLASAIAQSPFDYLALGHHHAALEVHEDGVLAAYSGSPTDSIGRGATLAVVDLQPDRASSVAIHAVEDWV